MSKRKLDPTDKANPNADIVDMLVELGNYERNKNRNHFKYNAYRRAADIIKKLDTPITSGAEARKLDGVGDKIAKKIDEILSTGKLRKLEEVRDDKDNKSIQELTRIFGIGPAYANQLFKEGIKGIHDLEKQPKKLNHQQKIGLKYYIDFEKRIPRNEMMKIQKVIIDEIKKLDDKFTAEVCGSFRRGAKDSGDIDFLLTHPTYTSDNAGKGILKKVVDSLTKIGFVSDTLSLGPTMFMGVFHMPDAKKDNPFRRIDIRLVPKDHYYCALLHSTGSDLFNKRMRALALEKGFTINEHSIRPLGSTGTPGEPLPVNSEADIFEYIGMPYCKPEDRTT